MTGTHSMDVDLPGRQLRWESKSVFRSDADGYLYEYERRVYENGQLLRESAGRSAFPGTLDTGGDNPRLRPNLLAYWRIPVVVTSKWSGLPWGPTRSITSERSKSRAMTLLPIRIARPSKPSCRPGSTRRQPTR